MKHSHKKHRLQLRLQWKYFSSFWKLISLVMCVSINKQLINCENCFGAVSRLCQGKRWEMFPEVHHLYGQHNTVLRATGWAGLSCSMHIVGHPTAVAIISTRRGRSYANFCLNEVWRIHSRNALTIRCVKQIWLLVLQENCLIFSQKQPVACQWLRQ